MADKNIKIRYIVEGVEDLERAAKIMGRTSDNTDQATNSTTKFNNELNKSSGILNKLKNDLAKFQKQRDEATDPKKIREFNKAIADTEKKINALTGKKPFLDLSSTISKVGASIAAAFAFDQIVEFGKKVIELTSQYQKFEAVLTNTLGSEKLAQGALALISETAAKTNFSVTELTDSYVKFANRGIKLTASEITKLADIANSTGKSFDQLTEAALDSFTGENERLKEFGITAKKTGQTTQFTFKGVTTEVKNTQEAVKNYILSLGDLEGVSGSTAKISQTLGGQISNLGDAFDQFLLSIGNGSEGPLGFFISKLTEAVNALNEFGKSEKEIKGQLMAKTLTSLAEKWEKLTLAELENLEASKQNARIRAIIAKDNEQIKLLSEQIHLVQDLKKKRIQALTEQANAEKNLGLLEKARAELKKAQEEREKALTESEVRSANRRVEAASKEVKRLEDLGKAAERAKIELEKLNSADLDGLTESAKRAKDAIEAVVKKQFGDGDPMKEQTEKFVSNIDEQIKARAKQAEFEDKKREEAQEKEKKYKEKQKQLYYESFQVAAELINNIAALENQKTLNKISGLEAEKQKQIDAAGDNTKARIAIEADFDKRIVELKKRQAQRDKRLATFNAIINIAQGVTKAIAEGGFAGILLGALVAAAGAVQIATINSQQTPQFNKGTKSVPGPNTGRDTVNANLTPGEGVFPVATMKKYRPILDKIFDHNISPELLNSIANGNFHGGVVMTDNKEVVKAIEGLPLNQFIWNEDGVEQYVQKKGSRTKYLNKRFSVK